MSKIILGFILILLTAKASSQQKFYVNDVNGNLIFADLVNCFYKTLCKTEVSMTDIAISPNGKLFSTEGRKLFEVNGSNCTVQPILEILKPSELITINSLLAIDNDILVAASNTGLLYKISIANTTSTLIGKMAPPGINDPTFDYVATGDLTLFKNKFYISTCRQSNFDGNPLLEFSLNSDFDKILEVNVIGNMVTLTDCSVYGLATVGGNNCQSDTLEVIAFEGKNIYSLNTDHASLTLLCNSEFSNNIGGAAAIPKIIDENIPVEFEIPNIFTPNNDNVNDFFQPTREIDLLNVVINIYNRWGELVYSKKDKTFMWDGKNNNGKYCTDGVYYYTIEFSNICYETKIRKGFLTLAK